jgi:hypothetical protein
MTDLPNVETLSPPPTEAETAWWNQYRRRKRWRGIASRFVAGVSAFGLFGMIRWPSLAREARGLGIGMAVVAGAAFALTQRPNTALFDEMTAAIRDRRVREALRAPAGE